MATYYRDTEVMITSSGVRAAGREWRLGELRQVWHRRGPRSWRTLAGRGVLGLAVLAPGAAGVIGAVVSLILHAPLWAVGVCVLLGLAGVPLADLLLDHVDRSYDRGSRLLEIWAATPAGDVLILRTADKLRFGRVYRALQRALESPSEDRSQARTT